MRKPGNLSPAKWLHPFPPPELRKLKRLPRMLQRLPGSFLARCVVTHLMRICCAQMHVRRQIMQLGSLLVMLVWPSVVLLSSHSGIPFRISNLQCQFIRPVRTRHRVFRIFGLIQFCGEAMALRGQFMLFSRIAMELVHAFFSSKNWAKTCTP